MVVVLLLLLLILWLGRGVRFTVLRSILPNEAEVSVKSGAEVKGVGEGAGVDVVGSGPCEVWVTCGVRWSCAGYWPSSTERASGRGKWDCQGQRLVPAPAYWPSLWEWSPAGWLGTRPPQGAHWRTRWWWARAQKSRQSQTTGCGQAGSWSRSVSWVRKLNKLQILNNLNIPDIYILSSIVNIHSVRCTECSRGSRF